MIAYDYLPGLIRMGEDRFLPSVSLSVAQLARLIPLHVLSAWDKCLLARPSVKRFNHAAYVRPGGVAFDLPRNTPSLPIPPTSPLPGFRRIRHTRLLRIRCLRPPV